MMTRQEGSLSMESSLSCARGCQVPAKTPLSTFALLSTVLFSAAVPLMYCHVAKQNAGPAPYNDAQIAKEVLSGKRLYSEVWTNRPPLGVLAYALPQLVRPHSYLAIAIFGGLCAVGAGWICSISFWGNVPAMLTTMSFLTLYPMTNWDYLCPSPELFANVVTMGILAIGLSIHRRRRFTIAQCVVTGALACVVFHIHQQAAVCLIIPAISVVKASCSTSDKVIGASAFVAGVLAGWASVLSIVALLGDLRLYWWTTFALPVAAAQNGSIESLVGHLTYFWQGGLATLVALAISLAAHDRHNLLFQLSVGILGTVVGITSIEQTSHSWLNSLPYIALMMGVAVQSTSAVLPRLAWSITLATLSVVMSVTVLRLYVVDASAYVHLMNVVQGVDQIAPADSTLYVCSRFGREAIQFASRLPSANTFEWSFQARASGDELLPGSFDQLAAEYLSRPPDVLVVQSELDQFAKSPSSNSELPGDLQLLRAMRAHNKYREVAEIEGFRVILRSKN